MRIFLLLSLSIVLFTKSVLAKNTANALLYQISSTKGECYVAGVIHARFEEVTKPIHKRIITIADNADVIFVESVKQDGFEFERNLNPYRSEVTKRGQQFARSVIDEKIKSADRKLSELAGTPDQSFFNAVKITNKEVYLPDVLTPLQFSDLVITTGRSIRLNKTSNRVLVSQGLDALIIQNSIKNNKKIYGLEGIDTHEVLWNDFLTKDQKRDHILESYERAINRDLLDDDQKLMQLIDEENSVLSYEKYLENIKNYPTHLYEFENIYGRRNQIWALKLEQFIKNNPAKKCLALVGAAHLFGDMSLLKQMRNYGFTVVEIKSR
jgi:uncharacterized protein YbaP (TraB family)